MQPGHYRAYSVSQAEAHILEGHLLLQTIFLSKFLTPKYTQFLLWIQQLLGGPCLAHQES